jgi:hypothetical protein
MRKAPTPQVNCPRCGYPHTQKNWDQLWKDWYIFFQRRKGFDAKKAFYAAHKEMKKHGSRPKGPAKPPLWLRWAARVGGKEMVKLLSLVWTFFNGKKTLIASILVGVPMIWDALSQILIAGGMPQHSVEYFGGLLLLIVGWAHKALKATGLAKKPDEK